MLKSHNEIHQEARMAPETVKIKAKGCGFHLPSRQANTTTPLLQAHKTGCTQEPKDFHDEPINQSHFHLIISILKDYLCEQTVCFSINKRKRCSIRYSNVGFIQLLKVLCSHLLPILSHSQSRAGGIILEEYMV